MRTYSDKLVVKHLECINPVKNTWCVRWDFSNKDGILSYEEKVFKYKPTIQEIKDLILDWYNKQTNDAILTGFVWKDMPVWLNSENQFNYKAAYDLAIQTSGLSLPIKFKFGTPDKPIYYTFTSLSDFSDFYVQAITYINATLDKGWTLKDNIKWYKYNE